MYSRGLSFVFLKFIKCYVLNLTLINCLLLSIINLSKIKIIETFLNMLSTNLAWKKHLKVKSAHPHSALSSVSYAN